MNVKHSPAHVLCLVFILTPFALFYCPARYPRMLRCRQQTLSTHSTG